MKLMICNSASEMVKVHKALTKAMIEHTLVPVPSYLGEVCNTAIRLNERDMISVEPLLRSINVTPKGIHTERKQGTKALDLFDNSSAEMKLIAYKVEEDIELSREDLLFLLENNEPKSLAAILILGDRVRKETVGDIVDIRGAIEFSNYCVKNCSYCGLRIENNRIKRYRMTSEEILEECKRIRDMGMETVILQSGEDPWYTEKIMVELIKSIKKETGLRITLSLGERNDHEYESFRAVGANNYLLKLESASPCLFKEHHPDGNFEGRLRAIRKIKSLGFLTGSGDIIGLPGQTNEDLVEDLLFLKREGIHMVGIGPFIPATNTPLTDHTRPSLEKSLLLVALARIYLKNVFIPATTAIATLDENGQKRALQVGANTIMTIETPIKYRENYSIYSGKKPVNLKESIELVKVLGRKLPRKIALANKV